MMPSEQDLAVRTKVLLLMKECLDHAAAIMSVVTDRDADADGIVRVEISAELMHSVLDPRNVICVDYDKLATFVSATINSEGPNTCAIWEIAHGLQHSMEVDGSATKH